MKVLSDCAALWWSSESSRSSARSRRWPRLRRASRSSRRRRSGSSAARVGGRLVDGRAVHDSRRRALPEGRREQGQHHGRDLGHRRRVRALLQGRDRPLRRVAADAAPRGYRLQGQQRRLLAGVHGRERRAHGRREPDNTWATCLTVAELKKIWEPGSKVNSWRDVRASFPNEPLRLFGPGTDSGTFEYFTEAINGRARASRSDYQASEDDNVLVQGVAGTRGGLGLLRLLVLRGEPDAAQGPPGREPEDGPVRHTVGRDRAEQQLQAARAAALHLREGLVVQAARRCRRSSPTSSPTRRRSRSERGSCR